MKPKTAEEKLISKFNEFGNFNTLEDVRIGIIENSENSMDLVVEAMQEFASQSKWISVEDDLPKVDDGDKFKKEYRTSVDVWTISDFGMRIGRYYHSSENWQIDGVLSGKEIIVTDFQYLPTPQTK